MPRDVKRPTIEVHVRPDKDTITYADDLNPHQTVDYKDESGAIVKTEHVNTSGLPWFPPVAMEESVVEESVEPVVSEAVLPPDAVVPADNPDAPENPFNPNA